MVGGQHHVQAAILQDKHGIHYIGAWLYPRANLDRCGKSRSHRDSIREPSSPSESLYRLRHPGPRLMNVDIESDPLKPTKCRFYESSIIVIRRKRNADSGLQMEVHLVLELCPKVLKYFYLRLMFPWQKCWLIHPFYQPQCCISRFGVS